MIVNMINMARREIENPRFVRNDGAIWLQCQEKDAQAIALHSNLYKILGKLGDTYYVEPYDADAKMNCIAQSSKQNAEDLSGAVFELDITREEIIEALFEIDGRMGVLENG